MASKEQKKPAKSAKPLALGKLPKPQRITSKTSSYYPWIKD